MTTYQNNAKEVFKEKSFIHMYGKRKPSRCRVSVSDMGKVQKGREKSEK